MEKNIKILNNSKFGNEKAISLIYYIQNIWKKNKNKKMFYFHNPKIVRKIVKKIIKTIFLVNSK